MLQKLKRQKGFTLLELLVILVYTGIATWVAAYPFTQWLAKSDKTVTVGTIAPSDQYEYKLNVEEVPEALR